jgi:hypothetical protein
VRAAVDAERATGDNNPQMRPEVLRPAGPMRVLRRRVLSGVTGGSPARG